MAEEKNFENKVKQFLQDEGCYFIKTHGDRFSKKGTPDLLICCNGFFVGCELKATNGVASELQKYHIKCIKDAGGIAMIIYPKDFNQFKKLIKFLKKSNAIGKEIIF